MFFLRKYISNNFAVPRPGTSGLTYNYFGFVLYCNRSSQTYGLRGVNYCFYENRNIIWSARRQWTFGSCGIKSVTSAWHTTKSSVRDRIFEFDPFSIVIFYRALFCFFFFTIIGECELVRLSYCVERPGYVVLKTLPELIATRDKCFKRSYTFGSDKPNKCYRKQRVEPISVANDLRTTVKILFYDSPSDPHRGPGSANREIGNFRTGNYKYYIVLSWM